MKAVVYNGPRDIAVTDVDDARIERPSDALVRITTTNICGSDLHMDEGRTDFEPGRTFGHENLGQVVEVGEDVERLQVGDWVCLPFNIACGKCVNCNRGLTNYCIEAQPMENMAGAAYGFADMGPEGAWLHRDRTARDSRMHSRDGSTRTPARQRRPAWQRGSRRTSPVP